MIKLLGSYLFKKMNSDKLAWKLLFMLAKNHEYKLVNRNSRYKNIGRGKRCFILGNGPSLNNIDFSCLEDEIVFTVNMLMDHPDFPKLKSNYHVIADNAIFKYDSVLELEDNYYLKKFKRLKECVGITLFAPVEAKKSIDILRLEEYVNISYFKIGNLQNSIKDFNLSCAVPSFNKVIHYAIGIASYMGFDEIYLLGCEETGIFTYLNLQLDNSTSNDHCYSDNDLVRNSWKKQLNKYGMAWEYREEATVLDNYRKMYSFCTTKGISLVNLTNRTLIDSIPTKKIEEILGR